MQMRIPESRAHQPIPGAGEQGAPQVVDLSLRGRNRSPVAWDFPSQMLCLREQSCIGKESADGVTGLLYF